MNTGKQFETDWKSSMPKDAWCYRLKDSAATYYGGDEVYLCRLAGADDEDG